ncbi:MAG: transcription termination/antitermination protein NusA, partial [Desulfobacca sp.]|nr:transcription termination/antitermination protein NusA [Desulfobacca sp.]
KIDIISWNPDPAKFICNALAPAEVIRVIIDEVNRSMEVVVPDDQLSLAIGKRGQNVRLASRLTGWKIDVKSESKYSKSMRDGYQSLLQITGVGEATADSLYKGGYKSAQEVAESNVDELVQISGITPKKAEKLLEAANEFLKITQPKESQVTNQDVEEEKATGDEELRESSKNENEVPVG